jgi:hypothetical protein
MDPITTRRLVHDRTAELQHTAAVARLERELRSTGTTDPGIAMAAAPAETGGDATARDAVPAAAAPTCLPGDARCATAERAA